MSYNIDHVEAEVLDAYMLAKDVVSLLKKHEGALAEGNFLEKVRDDVRQIYEAAMSARVFMWTYEQDPNEEPERDWIVRDSLGELVCVCTNELDAEYLCNLNNEAFDDKSDIRRHVEEFHRVYGLPVEETPRVPSKEVLDLRLGLIAEEFIELLEACGVEEHWCKQLQDDVRFALKWRRHEKVDLPEVADALGDLDYVNEGARLTCGINGKPIADEIQHSNMSKLDENGKPIKREDGKILKGPFFSEPDIRGELVRQGWPG